MMTFELNYEGFDAYLLSKRFDNELGGIMYRFKFRNNYRASVVKHKYSYGSDKDLWELAVIRFRGDDWELDYDTPITSDVEGYLTDKKVRALLHRIKDL